MGPAVSWKTTSGDRRARALDHRRHQRLIDVRVDRLALKCHDQGGGAVVRLLIWEPGIGELPFAVVDLFHAKLGRASREHHDVLAWRRRQHALDCNSRWHGFARARRQRLRRGSRDRLRPSNRGAASQRPRRGCADSGARCQAGTHRGDLRPGSAPAAATIACFRELGLDLDLIPGAGLLAPCVPGSIEGGRKPARHAWLRGGTLKP